MINPNTLIYAPVDMDTSSDLLSLGCIPVRHTGIPIFSTLDLAFAWARDAMGASHPAVFSMSYADFCDATTPTCGTSGDERHELNHSHGDMITLIFKQPVDFGLYEGARIHHILEDTGDLAEDRLMASAPSSDTADGWLSRATDKPIILMTGSQGSGKTTLAEKLREAYAIPLYTSPAGLIWRAWGFGVNDPLDLNVRVNIQTHIFKRWLLNFRHAMLVTGGIFDRTPIDFCAYLLSEVGRAPTTYDADIMAYIDACMSIMRDVMGHNNISLIFVPPLAVPSSQDRGALKCPSDTTYAVCVDMLIRGLLANQAFKHLTYIPDTVSGLFERVVFVDSALREHPLYQLTLPGIYSPEDR